MENFHFGAASAEDWGNVPVQLHQEYQATQGSGNSWGSAYSGGFPLRLRGVVVNANEDWLDPTAAFDADYHPYQLGGQAEFVVEAAAEGDFGGTFCWMGQNYGNMTWIQDSSFNYSNAEWYAELNRLRFWHPDEEGLPRALPREQLVRPGDYVEIRARSGLWYGGKMNVNEQHNRQPSKDFEVVMLERGRGWNEPENLTLIDLKNADNSFVFDAGDPRATGGEHYQGSQVTLLDVHLPVPTVWGKNNKDVTVADATGRTFVVHLSLGSGFADFTFPQGTFSVTGIVDQASLAGNSGYRLLAMNLGDFFRTWSKGSASGNWNSAANWGGTVLGAGEGIHFGGAAGGMAVNDFAAGQAVGGMVFESGAGALRLEGNSILLTGDVTSFSTQTQTVAMPIALNAEEHTFYAAAGEIVVEEAMTNDGYLRKIGLDVLTLAGGIHGGGTLDVAGGVLNALSIVQDRLVIGGNSNGAISAANVPEPGMWVMLGPVGLGTMFLMLSIRFMPKTPVR